MPPAEFLCVRPCILLCAFFHKADPVTGPAVPLMANRPVRELLIELYTVATGAVNPGPAVAQRLARLDRAARRRWILALGKAAIPMARAAVETLASWGQEPVGGVIVGPA